MIESTPPTPQAASITNSLPDAPAISDGVRKIPAPTTIPMVIANASRTRKVARGEPLSAIAGRRFRLCMGLQAGVDRSPMDGRLWTAGPADSSITPMRVA